MTITRLAAAMTLAATTVCLSACSAGSPATTSHTVTKTVTASPSSANTVADDMPQKVTARLYHAYSWTYELAEGDKGSTDPRDGDMPPYILPKNAATIRTSDGVLTVGLNLRYLDTPHGIASLTPNPDSLFMLHATDAGMNSTLSYPAHSAFVPVAWSLSAAPVKSISTKAAQDPVRVTLVTPTHRVALFSPTDNRTTVGVIIPQSEVAKSHYEIRDGKSTTNVSLLGSRMS